MTTEDVKVAVRRHRTAAVTGGGVGLVLLVAWVCYVIAATPDKPSIELASAADVVAYIANSRGLSALPEIEQRQFIERWRLHVAESTNADELKSCLESLDDEERAAFTAALFEVLKQSFLDDAETYSRLDTAVERGQFCRRKVSLIEQQESLIKDVGSALTADAGSEKELGGWLLRHTTEEERRLGQSFLTALKRMSDQMRKEARGEKQVRG